MTQRGADEWVSHTHTKTTGDRDGAFAHLQLEAESQLSASVWSGLENVGRRGDGVTLLTGESLQLLETELFYFLCHIHWERTCTCPEAECSKPRSLLVHLVKEEHIDSIEIYQPKMCLITGFNYKLIFFFCPILLCNISFSVLCLVLHKLLLLCFVFFSPSKTKLRLMWLVSFTIIWNILFQGEKSLLLRLINFMKSWRGVSFPLSFNQQLFFIPSLPLKCQILIKISSNFISFIE